MSEGRGRGGGELVRTRDHLANTRTLLSWFRAGLAIVAIGFSITKLHLLEGFRSGSPSVSRLGIAVATIGLVLIGVTLARFLQHRRNIERSEFRPQVAFDAALIAAAAVTGVLVLVVAIGR